MEPTSLIAFAGTVAMISLSGAMMPGPVTAVTVARGSRTPHAGALVALGHAAVELPLMAAIYFGAGLAFQLLPVKVAVGVLGGAILFWMGLGMLRDRGQAGALEESERSLNRSPFVSGILLSAGNPYFLIWWATMGAVLVDQSAQFKLLGFAVLVAAHWSADFLWLYFLSALSFTGGKFFGNALQKGVFIVCGLVLLGFSSYFAVRAVMTLVNSAGPGLFS